MKDLFAVIGVLFLYGAWIWVGTAIPFPSGVDAFVGGAIWGLVGGVAALTLLSLIFVDGDKK